MGKIDTGIYAVEEEGRVRITAQVNGRRFIKYYIPKCIHTISRAELIQIKKIREDMLGNIKYGEYQFESGDTVDKFFYSWIEITQKATSTKDRDIEYYERYIKPYIGHMRLTDVRKLTVDKMIKDYSEKYSVNTISTIHSVLSQIFKEAVDNDLIKKSPVIRLKKSKLRAKEQKSQLLLNQSQEEEFFSLLKERSGNLYYNPVRFAILTGLREGELLGLKWNDVDLNDGTLSVRRSLAFNRKTKEFYEKPPKTKAGIRTFKIHPEALEILRSMEKRSIYIFVNSNIVHFRKEDFGKVIRGVRKKMETLTPADRDDKNKQLSLYSMRHFFATHCVEAGVKPKALAKIMGHEDFRTTMKFYVDASDLMLEDAYDKMYTPSLEKVI